MRRLGKEVFTSFWKVLLNMDTFSNGNKTKQRSSIKQLTTLDHYLDAEAYIASAFAESFYSFEGIKREGT